MLKRRLLLALLGLAVGGGVLSLLAGELLTRPVRSALPDAPIELGARRVEFPTPAGRVGGWLAPGQAGRGAVLLMHGVRGSRLQMLERARFLQGAGYTALLIDMPAHGESEGQRITFGARESTAAEAALSYLRRAAPGERVAVVGVSLGAASHVLAHHAVAPDAIVLESMYPTIREAVANRLAMRLGEGGRLMAGPLLWQLPLRLGISETDLQPIAHLGRLGAPVAIASGTRDEHTPWSETLRLFEAAKQPKELWPFEGAIHEDLHRFDRTLYEARLLRFLARHLRNAA